MVETSRFGTAHIGGCLDLLTEHQIRAFVHDQLPTAPFDGRSVCVLVPDATRSCPLPLLLKAVHGALHGRVTRLTVLVALGTHAKMTEKALAAHLGYRPGASADYHLSTTVLNHGWWDPLAFATLRAIPADRIAELSDGRLHDTAEVRINRAVVEHDVTLIVGPVFPYEVVGFSGGDKHLFPGVSGRKFVDVPHRLGALNTSAEIIGTRGTTPVRALIDEAASMIPGERLALCVVTGSPAGSLHSMAFGDPEAAWAERPRCRPSRTSGTSTRPFAGSCRCSRPDTRTSGPVPRAFTKSSRSSPTAARSSCTRRTSPKSPPPMPRSSKSVTTAATTS